jgi:hypothetical protein
MRAVVSEILARRMPQPPAEFLALQVSRLNEALIVAYGAMSGMDLRAVDRVVKIVRELDRYHGFIAADRRSLRRARGIEAKAQGPLALMADRPDMAPQEPEKTESAPGNAMASSDPQDPAFGQGDLTSIEPRHCERPPGQARGEAIQGNVGRPTAPGSLRRFAPRDDGGSSTRLHAPLTDRLDMAPQEPEKAQSAPGNGGAPDASDEATRLAAPAQDPPDALPTDRPEMAPQQPEKPQFAPGNGMATNSSDPEDAASLRDEALSRRQAPAQAPFALDAPLTRRIEIAPQALERPESVARNGMGAEPACGLGGASFVSPAVGNLNGVKWPNVRATLNGVAAC